MIETELLFDFKYVLYKLFKHITTDILIKYMKFLLY